MNEVTKRQAKSLLNLQSISKLMSAVENNIPLSPKNIISFSLFFFLALFLMSFGYFQEFSEMRFNIYFVAILSWGAFFVLWAWRNLSYFQTFYTWLIFLLFFPKKELVGQSTLNLFNLGFGLLEDAGSIHLILEFFFITALLFNLVKERKNILNFENRAFKYIFYSLCTAGLIGLMHILVVGHRVDKNPFISLFELDQIFLAIFALLFAPLIQTKKQVKTILIPFVIMGTLLALEYFLGRFRISPLSVRYYSFNYRNAFRSIFMANDLMMGLMSFAAIGSAFYFYLNTKKNRYLIMFIAFHLLVLETFNRAHSFPLYIAIFLACLISRKIKFIAGYIIIVIGLNLISLKLSTIQPPKDMGRDSLSEYEWVANYSGYSKPVHYGYDRPGGYLSKTSSLERFGAFYRAFDLIVTNPLMGIGPGNSKKAMMSDRFKSYFDLSSLPYSSQEFYQKIKNGEHPSNSHNLYIHLVAEYGIIILLALLAIGYLIFRKTAQMVIRGVSANNENLSFLFVTYAMAGYFCFQVKPLLLALFILFMYLFIRFDELREE